MRWLFLFLFTGISLTGFSQVRIEVDSYPPFKGNEDRLFLACSCNDWAPGDPRLELKRQPNGTYALELPDTLTRFKYKFTQGYWTLVEGNADGSTRQDREFVRTNQTKPIVVHTSITGWETRPAYRFIIKRIPDNTPHDATLYISGNFNNWNPGDEAYRLHRQIDGTYRVSVITDQEQLEYKFTRGDWNSVEGQEGGRMRPNRTLRRRSELNPNSIDVQIDSWEDLSGAFNFFLLYDLLLLFSVFQGLSLAIAIPTMQDYNRKANRWLVIALFLTAIAILLHVLGLYRSVIQGSTRLLLIPDFIYFVYPPLFYFYLQKLLFKTPSLPQRWGLRFIPAGIVLLVYMPFLLMGNGQLQNKIISQALDLASVSWAISIAGWLFSGYYWFLCYRAVQTYQRQYRSQIAYDQNTQYLMAVLVIQALCLITWLFSGMLLVISKVVPWEMTYLAQQSTHLVWLVFSTLPSVLGYYAIHQPEIFKVTDEPVTSQTAPPLTSHLAPPHRDTLPKQPEPDEDSEPTENLESYRELLDNFMLKHKPYTTPGLTISDLANQVGLSAHLLSRVINMVYDKNFFDFINSYRIEELKHQFIDPRNKNYTLLAIALDVGFNSKTAFNRAFKKHTNQTPSAYFFDKRLE